MKSTSNMLESAVRHHQAGEFEQAEQFYRRVLKSHPKHPDALHLLGVMSHQLGRHEKAIEYIQRAIKSHPRAAFHSNLGLAFHALGKFDQAIDSYRQACELSPNLAEVQNNLGNALCRKDRLVEAEACYRRAIELKPDYAEAHTNLGNSLKSQERVDEAIGSYQRALEIKPDYPHAIINQADALHLLGVVSLHQGRHDMAVEQIDRAISLNPKESSFFNNFGLACHALGRFEKAMAAYRCALELAPKNAEVLGNLANLLYDQGHVQEAIDCYKTVISLKPDYAEAHCNLANMLKHQRRPDEAAQNYRRAIELRGDYARAHQALGNVLADLGRLDEAAASYRQVARIRSDPVLPELKITSLCPKVVRDSRQIDDYRRTLLEQLERLSGHARNIDLAELSFFGYEPPFDLLLQGRDDRPIREAYAAVFKNGFPRHAPPGSDGPPRIGFVVTNGHEGIFIRCMRGILENLQPGLFRLAIICSPGGMGKIGRAINVAGLDLLAIPERFDRAVELIQEKRFDLLYYWEIGTDPTNYFLPFCRLAPVQCTSWGVPGTSGISEVDYYLSSDLIEVPEAHEHYTERLFRAQTLLAYEYRITLPDSPKRRSDFDLPSDRNVYLCPQQLGKIHPDFDPILGKILERDERGLVVLVEDYNRYAGECLRERLARTIPDVFQRIVFLRRQSLSDYMCLVASADVLLDSLHYGGGITAYDGFSFDQPIVTLPSEYRRGRYALGCYRKMEIMDCVAATAEEYVDIAVRLGTDREYRESIRARIRSASAVLFEDLESVREFERFMLGAVRRSRASAGSIHTGIRRNVLDIQH